MKPTINNLEDARAHTGDHVVRDAIAKNETAEVCCHFCGRRHYLPPEQLRELLPE